MVRRSTILAAGTGLAVAGLLARRKQTTVAAPEPDRAWWKRPGEPSVPKVNSRYTLTSQYVAMPDGVRLAVDVYLPEGRTSGTRLPTVLLSTRYHRRRRWRNGFVARIAHQMRIDARHLEARRYTSAGYAFVAYDARGSGASFGWRLGEPGPLEIRDGAGIADWIIAQPWSDGTIGGTGISYEGSTAELLLSNCHPAVRGAVVRFSGFDPFVDAAYIGGVRQSWFLDDWSDMNVALDADRAEEHYARLGGGAIKLLARLTAGVARVDEDVDDRLIRQAIAEHSRNVGASSIVEGVIFRDGFDFEQIAASAGLEELPEGTSDTSAAASVDAIAKGGAMYSYAGWYDSAYAWAAIKRFKALEAHGARLIVGPWDHGGRQLVDPTTPVTKASFDQHGELLRFFDHVVRQQRNGIEDEPPVRYYTAGDGWRTASTWPPPGLTPTPFYFGPGGSLGVERPGSDGVDRYRVDPTHTSGTANRWRSILNLRQEQIAWPDRIEQDRKLLVYETASLPQGTEITGHPVAVLYVRSTADDGSFHVYLEEVTAAGEVRYITEGVFRARHRRVSQNPPAWETLAPYHSLLTEDDLPLVPGDVAELAFGLQPISYRVAPGSRVRVAIGGADADNFELVPATPPTIELIRSPEHPSHILLPVPS